MTGFSTLQEMLVRAHDRLKPDVWDFIAGGTESEVTLRRNRQALECLALRPRVLRDVSEIDTSTTVLGHRLSIPVMMAPVGSLALVEPAGAIPVARACAATGTMMFYSVFADPSLAEVRAAVPHPIIVALYVRGGSDWIAKAVDDAVAAGCSAIAVVTEAAYYSRRERDLMSGLRSRGSKSGSYGDTQRVLREGQPGAALDAARSRMAPARLNWATIEHIRKRSGLPIILKGINTREDALIAAESGIEAVYVSNHGGRQLDQGQGSLDSFVQVADALKGRAELIVDGGICRGTDVIKALALGARATCVGRMQCWALAAGGEEGLRQMIEILEEEIIIAMGLIGVTRPSEIGPEHIQAVEAFEPADLLNAFPVAKELIAEARADRRRRERESAKSMASANADAAC